MTCDLCGSHDGVPILRGNDRRFGLPGDFRVVQCPDCGLTRTEPQPDDLAKHYPPDAYYSYDMPSVSPLVRAAVASVYGRSPGGGLARRIVTRLAASRISGLPAGPPGDLLDVGSGSGAMLLALEEAGWRCHGIEVDEGAVRKAHAAGLTRVRAGDLVEEGYSSASFDAVRFAHSLEHMRSPRTQLEEARRVLRPRGQLTVAVPDFGSLLRRLAGERWFFLDLPRHLWHFSRPTLTRLVRETGFEIRRIRNVTASSAILGTLDYLLQRGETLVSNGPAWYGVQPISALLDVLGLGDELELTAVAR